MKKLKEFKPLWILVKEDRKKFVFASILIFITELTNIVTGYLIGQSTQYIVNNALKQALVYLLIYLFLELIFCSCLRTYANSLLNKIESLLTRKLCFNSYKKSLELPAYAYEKISSGEVINRITHDADSLSFAFGQLLNVLSSLVGAIILIIYVLIKSWIVGLEIILFLTILFLILKKYNPLLKQAHKDRKTEHDKFTSLTNESIRGIREIKTLGVRDSLVSDMTNIMKILLKKSYYEVDVYKRFNIIMRSLRSCLEVITFILCIFLLYYNQINLSFLIAMTYYVYRFTYLVDQIDSFTQTYQRVSVSLERVNEILENRIYEDDKYGNKVLKNPEGIIEFKNVTFAYPDEDDLLKNFNLKIVSNKKIAIVGKSGQGKSTLFNLITRIFDPKDGEILIDGVNIKDLEYDSLRKVVSVIRQEPFIFNRSFKDNFKIIDSKITLKEIRNYSKIAYLDDYIMSLPMKYDTLLGEGGVNLSGGQKQRLSIARTLAKESKIILFDEATSALDNNSQEYIKSAINNLVKDHTVVIVAHRLSTIIDSDIIYVIDDGKAVASGTHDELLKSSKIYKNLYETESLNL